MSPESIKTNSHELAVFYNTENFFSAKTPKKGTPLTAREKNWDQRRFIGKLDKISHVFELIKEEHGVLPVLIGLSEIQGANVLQQLVSTPVFSGKFEYVHFESMDERGVDVALLYDASVIEIISTEPISFFFEIEDGNPENYDTTRDVLCVKVRFETQIINIFVFHLPSKREKDINKPKRKYIIGDIREKVLGIIEEKNESVLLMGDFNENPDEDNVRNLIYDDKLNRIMHNPFEELFQNGTYSTFHREFGLLFDQILLSDDFYKESTALKFKSAAVFNHQKLTRRDKKFAGYPFRTFAGSRYLGGYSDHFPVLVQLVRNQG